MNKIIKHFFILFICVVIFIVILPIRFNTSESLPHWFYWVTNNKNVSKGEAISFCLPFSDFIANSYRGDCPSGQMALVKIVIATEGDFVSMNKLSIKVNGQNYPANWLETSTNGKNLPEPDFRSGVLESGEYIVYSPLTRSFDSRYYGVINDANIVGRAIGW